MRKQTEGTQDQKDQHSTDSPSFLNPGFEARIHVKFGASAQAVKLNRVHYGEEAWAVGRGAGSEKVLAGMEWRRGGMCVGGKFMKGVKKYGNSLICKPIARYIVLFIYVLNWSKGGTLQGWIQLLHENSVPAVRYPPPSLVVDQRVTGNP